MAKPTPKPSPLEVERCEIEKLGQKLQRLREAEAKAEQAYNQLVFGQPERPVNAPPEPATSFSSEENERRLRARVATLDLEATIDERQFFVAKSEFELQQREHRKLRDQLAEMEERIRQRYLPGMDNVPLPAIVKTAWFDEETGQSWLALNYAVHTASPSSPVCPDIDRMRAESRRLAGAADAAQKKRESPKDQGIPVPRPKWIDEHRERMAAEKARVDALVGTK
jgi:hypothetical protein